MAALCSCATPTNIPSNPRPLSADCSAKGVCPTTLVPNGCIGNSIKSGGGMSHNAFGVLPPSDVIGVLLNK